MWGSSLLGKEYWCGPAGILRLVFNLSTIFMHKIEEEDFYDPVQLTLSMKVMRF
jgi:hypothetical protein